LIITHQTHKKNIAMAASYGTKINVYQYVPPCRAE
jgi:hypothetical protein